MRVENLPSPGTLSNSIYLRTAAAKAISNAEVVAGRSGGTTSTANTLHTFFTACATAVAGLRDLVAPTITARTAPVAAANVVTLTCSEGLDPTVVPAAAAWTFSPARTVTKTEIVGNRLILTVNLAVANGNTVAYTAPGTNALRDAGGNLLATFAAQAIVVA
jgi:hypothetical protein